MKWRYDPDANAAYLRFSNAKIVESEEVRPNVVFDFDDAGRIVGIEVLDARGLLAEEELAGADPGASARAPT